MSRVAIERIAFEQNPVDIRPNREIVRRDVERPVMQVRVVKKQSAICQDELIRIRLMNELHRIPHFFRGPGIVAPDIFKRPRCIDCIEKETIKPEVVRPILIRITLTIASQLLESGNAS